MTTYVDIVRDALSAIGVVGEGQRLTPEASQQALRILNAMLSSWEQDGINVQFVPARQINETFAFPPDYELAAAYNLAILLAPHYGRQVPAEVAMIARQEYGRLIRAAVNFAFTEVAPTIPASESQWQHFDIVAGTVR